MSKNINNNNATSLDTFLLGAIVVLVGALVVFTLAAGFSGM